MTNIIITTKMSQVQLPAGGQYNNPTHAGRVMGWPGVVIMSPKNIEMKDGLL